jgi:hypothetical protein
MFGHPKTEEQKKNARIPLGRTRPTVHPELTV